MSSIERFNDQVAICEYESVTRGIDRVALGS